MDPLWRRSEALIHGVIGAFAPQLRDVPVEGRPWRFTAEARDPTPVERLRSRLRLPVRKGAAPEPGGPVPAGKPWNWRLEPSPELLGLMRAGIVEAHEALKGDGLAAVVDEPHIVGAGEEAPGGRMDVLWHMYTVSVMLTDAFASPAPPDLSSLSIPVPESPSTGS